MAYNPQTQNPADSPPEPVCFGFNETGGCTETVTNRSFCARHQDQGVWLFGSATAISAAERLAHTRDRRCCGLTQRSTLCNRNTGGNFLFCWSHRGQQGPRVRPAIGSEPRQRAILRERFHEFWRMKDASFAEEQHRRDQLMREEQRRREEDQRRREEDQRRREEEQLRREEEKRRCEEEQRRRREEERTRAEREDQERRRQWQKQWQREQQEQEQREREQRREQERWRQQHRQQRSYQQGRWEEAPNANQRARQDEGEKRSREHQQREEEQANERVRRAYEEREAELRAMFLQEYLEHCATFDATDFSTSNPNTFSRIPWPVFPRPDGTIRVEDVTAENIRLFFDAERMQAFGSTSQRDGYLKRAAHRFHPDRFSTNRPVIATIRNWWERQAATEAADIVIKTVNDCRDIDT